MNNDQILVFVELLDSINTQLTKIADTLDGMACNQLSENDEQTPADSLNQIAKDFRKYTESLNKGKSND